MIRRLAPNALMFFALLLSACSGSDDGGDSSAGSQADKSGRGQVTIVPLPDNVGDSICSLTRHATERDLIAIFGEPDDRKEAEGVVTLRWKTDSLDAGAMFENGLLTIAGANAIQHHKPGKHPLKDHPTWIAGETRLDEMESHLGPGVRVGVQWQAGSDITQSIRESPGFDESMTRDLCNERYAWTNLDAGSLSSLFFSDGILRGVL